MAAIGVTNLVFLVIVVAYSALTGDLSGLPYFLLLGLISGIGWQASRRGYWRWVRRWPMVFFLLLGLYGSIVSGFSTIMVAGYILAFILAGLLVNRSEMLAVALLGIIAHTLIDLFAHQGNVIDQISGAITLTAFFSGILLLQWLNTELTETALDLSLTDPLTGAYNRGFYDAILAQLQTSDQFPVTILIADVNRLKRVNDEQGHAAGDAIIVRAARCLRTVVKPKDFVCRIGGDEFAVICPQTDVDCTSDVVQRLSRIIAADNGTHPGATLSLAVGLATATQADTLPQALQQADSRMYDNKYEAR